LGKTTTGRAILRLIEPTDGEILFEGKNILKKNEDEMRQLRREMQIIFQDPYSSLNPRMSVGGLIREGLISHGIGTPSERRDRIIAIMEKVGLRPEQMNRSP
jgi:ABC-type microcin C transport system duplicated ATPase subunit YejF